MPSAAPTLPTCNVPTWTYVQFSVTGQLHQKTTLVFREIHKHKHRVIPGWLDSHQHLYDPMSLPPLLPSSLLKPPSPPASSSLSLMCKFPRAAVTIYHQLGKLKTTQSYSLAVLWPWISGVKTQQSSICLCLHMVFFLHVSVSPCKATCHIGLGSTSWFPLNLITSAMTLFPNKVTFTGTGD